jgi:hypothetical protein
MAEPGTRKKHWKRWGPYLSERLLGCPSIAALDRSYVNVPKSWDWS